MLLRFWLAAKSKLITEPGTNLSMHLSKFIRVCMHTRAHTYTHTLLSQYDTPNQISVRQTRQACKF